MPDPDFQTPLEEGAANMHELFISYMHAGFTPGQALYLVGQVVRAMFGQAPA